MKYSYEFLSDTNIIKLRAVLTEYPYHRMLAHCYDGNTWEMRPTSQEEQLAIIDKRLADPVFGTEWYEEGRIPDPLVLTSANGDRVWVVAAFVAGDDGGHVAEPYLLYQLFD